MSDRRSKSSRIKSRRPAERSRVSPPPQRSARSASRPRRPWGRRWFEFPIVRDAVATPSHRRVTIVWALLVAAGAGLTLNLLGLQLFRASTLQTLAGQQQQRLLADFVPRRTIVDRQGVALAIDRPVYTLYAHPQLFDVALSEMARSLSPVLGRSPLDLEAVLASANSGVRVTDFLSETSAERVSRLGFDGLELVRHAARLYPQNELAAAVVGYVNFDGDGQAGIEYSQQDRLRRQAEVVGDTDGENGILDRSAPPFVRLDDLELQLTLDSRLQRSVRQALIAQMEQFEAKQGTVIIMDARDGSLLCLVSEPSYNPNRYYETPVERFKNWALSDLYEPGSTFKPINVAIALEAGAIRPTDTFYDPGQIFIDGWEIANYDYESAGGRGQVSVTEILRDSSNVGMVRIVQQMDASDYYDWLERIELGRPTEIDLPFEASGQLKSREQFVASPVEAATTSFGQGFAITPIQLVKLYGALANQGYLVTPHVVRGLSDPRGKLQKVAWQTDPQRIFSSETVRSVLAMMEEAIESGTGQNAKIPGYRISGKTGTAQKSRQDGGGYSESAVVASFVAVFPTDDPRYVVFVALDEPSRGSGGTAAAPVAREAMEMTIAIEDIPPSDRR
ncbi:peptidoglycan D,D-transpeptidase FtsI family protein [Baaleninema simplex]|uniref:peptidoglycan D,D-transpeptidase FtsI family protein n=1 Tax=Baaleninema simplex TaxID=2862350 RepID=UPI00034B1B18|nr:penicillin-binding protein 2 [Baaleninema simplex]